MTGQATEDQALQAFYDSAEDMPAEAGERIRHQLAARMATSVHRPRRKVRWLIGAPAFATAAAAVAAIVAFGSSAPTGPVVVPPATPTSAEIPNDLERAATLDLGGSIRLLAANADRARPLSQTGNGYLYIRAHGENIAEYAQERGSFKIRVGSTVESWYPAAGGQPLRTRRVDGTTRIPLTPADRAAAARAGYDLGAPAQVTDSLVPRTRGPKELPSSTGLGLPPLPPDRAGLRAHLAELGGTDKTALFKEVCSLLLQYDGVLTPVQRRALYEILGEIPGVARIPGKTTVDGRTGIAFAMTRHKLRQEIIVDPTTTRVIGGRYVLVERQGTTPAGTQYGWEVRTHTLVPSVPGVPG